MKRTRHLIALLVAAFIFSALPGKAYADCATPTAPVGSLQYFVGDDMFKYCDSNDNWIDWGSGGAATPAGSDRQIQFNSGGTTLGADANFVYNSAGQLGIGTSTPFGGSAINIVSDNTSGQYDLILQSYDVGSTAKLDIDFMHARGTPGSPAAMVDNDWLGTIRWSAYGSGAFRSRAQISAQINGTVSGTTIPTDLSFAAGDTGAVDRMWVRSDGTVAIGTNASGGELHVSDGADGDGDSYIFVSSTAANESAIWFQNNSGGTGRWGAVGVYGTDDALRFTGGNSSLDDTDTHMIIENAGDVGIGTISPNSRLDVATAAASDPTFRLSDGDVTLPDYSGSASLGDVSASTAVAQIKTQHASDGGAILFGYTGSGVNDGEPLKLVGTHGGTAPTSPAVLIDGQKHSGTNNRTLLADAETVLDIRNIGIPLMRILGDGNIFMYGTGAVDIPAGTTGERPTVADNGMLRYNSDTNKFEGFEAGSWANLVGGGAGGLWTAGTGDDIYYNSGSPQVGIGTTAPTANLHLYDTGNDANYSMLLLEGDGEPAFDINTSSASSGLNPLIRTTRSRGARGAKTIVSNGDTLFEFVAKGYDGAADIHGAYISTLVDGAPGANDMPTRIEFHTQAAGGGASLEGTTPELVIKNDGKIGMGTATPAEDLHIYDSAGRAGLIIESENANNAVSNLQLFTKGDGAKTLGDAANQGWYLGAYDDTYATAAQQNDLAFWSWDGTTWANRMTMQQDTGYIGIGTNDPTNILTIVGDNLDPVIASYSAVTGSGAQWQSYRARGSETAKVPVQANDSLGGFRAGAWDGSQFEIAGGLEMYIDAGATVADEVIPTNMQFQTRDATDTSAQDRMQISSDGIVSFLSTGAFVANIGTTAQRPTASSNGMMRYNTTTAKFEGYENGSWTNIVGGGAGGLWTDGAGDIIYYNSGTPLVGIGTATPTDYLHVAGELVDEGIAIESFNDTDANGGNVTFRRTRGTEGSKVIVNDGDEVGHIMFRAFRSGSNYDQIAAIVAIVDGDPTGGLIPGRLTFGTRLDNGSFFERMVIKNDGKIGMGTSDPDTILHIYEAGAGTADFHIETGGSGISQISFEENSQTENFNIHYDGAENQFEFEGMSLPNIMTMARDRGSIAIGGTTDTMAADEPNIPNGSLTIENGALCVDGGDTSCDDEARTAGFIYGTGMVLKDGKLDIISDDGLDDIDVISYGANQANIDMNRGRGDAAGPLIIQDDDAAGGMRFVGYDGDSFEHGAWITGTVDGTPGDDNMPMRIEFLTRPDGNTDNPVERMRIDSDGIVSFTSTGAFLMNNGTTGERPTASNNGMMRYNTTTAKFEGYQAGSWQDLITAGGTPAGANTQIQFNSSGSFGASANFVWDQINGHVGINEPAPAADLVVVDSASDTGTDAHIFVNNDGANQSAIWFSNNQDGTPRWAGIGVYGTDDALRFTGANNDLTDAETHMIIGQTGLVGIGTVSPADALHIAGDLDDEGFTIESFYDTDPDGGNIRFLRSHGTEGSETIVSNNDETGHIWFKGHDGSAHQNMASIVASVDGAPGAGDMPGRLEFWTTPVGTSIEVERMRIDNAGNVGIGTESPTGRLHVAEPGSSTATPILERSGQTTDGFWTAARLLSTKTSNMGDGFGTSLAFNIQDDTSGIVQIASVGGERDGADNSGAVVFETWNAGSGSEKMRIKPDGNVGIGTDAPDSALDIASDGQTVFTINSAGASSGANSEVFGRRSRGTQDSRITVQDGDGLLDMVALGWDGNSWEVAAFIGTEVDGGAGDGDMPGKIIFNTTPDGSTTWQERMRIDNAGYVGINMTDADVELDVTGDIEYTGTITDVSDRRLKDNITPLGSMLDKVSEVKTYSFTMKEDEDKKVEYGVLAQEIEQIFPELVKTAEDEIGTKSVNYVGLIAPMIEATKELKAENEALKAELDSVKTKLADVDDLRHDVKALKAHTGYGINKAAIGIWVLVGMGFMGLLFLVTGNLIRTRRREE